MPSSAVYCQCHSFLCLIPMPETSLSLQTFIFKHIQAISLFLSISAIIISLFWIWKPGVSWKAIIVLFLTWQFLFVVHSVFLSNLFPPKLFFLLTALLILFLVSVRFSFLRWPTKDFFLIGLTLCLFLEYKYILSFCLFIHSNYFFLAISGMSVLAFSGFSGCYFESSQGHLLIALTLQLTGYGCWKFNLLPP